MQIATGVCCQGKEGVELLIDSEITMVITILGLVQAKHSHKNDHFWQAGLWCFRASLPSQSPTGLPELCFVMPLCGSSYIARYMGMRDVAGVGSRALDRQFGCAVRVQEVSKAYCWLPGECFLRDCRG